MKTTVQRYYRVVEWGLGTGVVVTAVAAWLSTRTGSSSLTLYDIFPPLGLIAFGLMWTHFVMGAFRRYGNVPRKASDAYMSASMGIVLGLLILHPGLLWLGLYFDGYGLPPESYLTVYSSQILAVGLGSIGLTIFLAFELKRWFGKKNWWKYVEWAQIAGMAAIFYHALQLGGELRQEWFMIVWWFYGITLAMAIVYSAMYKKREGRRNGQATRQ